MLKIVSLVLLVGLTNAIVCEPEYCVGVACDAVTNGNCNGVVRPNGGFCGCCDVCITQLAEGDDCRATLLLGLPATSECGSGLTCDGATFTCKRSVQKRQAAICVTPRGTEISGFMVNRWEAIDMDCQCARDRFASQQQFPGMVGRRFYCYRFGNYEPVGCTGGSCYCQDRRGNRIGEAVHIVDANRLNC